MKKPFPFYILWFILSVFVKQIDAATCKPITDSEEILSEEKIAADEIAAALSSLLKLPVSLTEEVKHSFSQVLFKHRRLVSSNRELRELLRSNPNKYVEIVLEQCERLVVWERAPDNNQYKRSSIEQILSSNMDPTEKTDAVAKLHLKSQIIKNNIEQAIAEHIQTAMDLYAEYTPVIPRRITPIGTASPPFGSGKTPTQVSHLCLEAAPFTEDCDYSTIEDDDRRSTPNLRPLSRETSPVRFGSGSFSKYVRVTPTATNE